MVEMYVRLIQNSEEWTIERVPEKYRSDVQTILEGGNENG
jgi:predicted 3-demethylubiquinone-9 3-methyltransferase (glyoxalase superfamily)